MRGLLGFLEDYAIAIKGSIVVRVHRIKQQMPIVLAAGALVAVLLVTGTLVYFERNDTGSDLAAPDRRHPSEAPAITFDDAEDSSSTTSTTDGGASADQTATDGEDADLALSDELSGDEQIASGPNPMGSSPSGVPGGDRQGRSAANSVGGSARSAPAPSSSPATTPDTPAPPTATTAPPASEAPPRGEEGSSLENLTRGVLDTVTGLL